MNNEYKTDIIKEKGEKMTYEEYLDSIHDQARERMKEVVQWIQKEYPNLNLEVKWSQPMFTDHGTFIIGFSSAKKHVAIACESEITSHIADEAKKLGLEMGKMTIKMPFDKEIPFSLIKCIIEHNIELKKDTKTFWK